MVVVCFSSYSTFANSVVANEESSFSGPTSFEQGQTSSTRAQWPVNWRDETSAQLNDPLSRSPVRLRGNLHDAPQTVADIPRSTSPYASFTRQAPVGQPPMAQSPPSATRGGFLDNSPGFSGGITSGQAFAGSNRLASGMSLRLFCDGL